MVCIHALYTVWKEEKRALKKRITNMYWKSLYGDTVPPFLVWHTPSAAHPPAIAAAQLPMLTYPGYEPVPLLNPNPTAPPRRRPKMVSAGETICYQVEEPQTLLRAGHRQRANAIGSGRGSGSGMRAKLSRNASADSLISSDTSELSVEREADREREHDRRGTVVLPCPYGTAAVGPGSGPLALPWNGPMPAPPPPRAAPMRARPPAPILIPIRLPAARNGQRLMKPVGIIPPRPTLPRDRNAFPVRCPLSPQLPPAPMLIGTRPAGPQIYEIMTVPGQKSPGATFDIDDLIEPGFENFMLRKSESAQLQNYRPKSLHEYDPCQQSEVSERASVNRPPVNSHRYRRNLHHSGSSQKLHKGRMQKEQVF